MGINLPLPKSLEKWISLEQVYKRWKSLPEFQDVTVIEFCEYMNGYHQEQSIKIYLDTFTQDGRSYQFTSEVSLSPDVPLQVANNRKKQESHERIILTDIESNNSLLGFYERHEDYEEVERLEAKHRRLSSLYRPIYWNMNMKEEVVIIIDHCTPEDSVLGAWNSIFLKRDDLESFEQEYGICLVKEKKVMSHSDSEASTETRQIDHVYPFLSPPKEAKQDYVFKVMEYSFVKFFEKNRRNVNKREAWGVVIQAIQQGNVPLEVEGYISVVSGDGNNPEIKDTLNGRPTNKRAFMARISTKQYNKINIDKEESQS